MWIVAMLLLWLSLAPVCHASPRLTCRAVDKQYAWVQQFEIDPERRAVYLSVAWSLPVRAGEVGKLEAVIEDMSQSQDGVPIYAFNAYPQGPTELTNMFKLFRLAGRWRLIGAATESQNGKPALRAIDSGLPYTCAYEK
jgi:hypothetical protein